MKIEDLKKLEKTKLKFFIKNNIIYTGKIIELNEDNIIILDKYENKVLIHTNIIERIEETK